MNDHNKLYPPIEKLHFSFGHALNALRKGAAVAREGWNGKGLWLKLQLPDAHSKMTHPYIYIEYPVDHPAYPEGSRVSRVASQTGLLADDWYIVPLSDVS